MSTINAPSFRGAEGEPGIQKHRSARMVLVGGSGFRVPLRGPGMTVLGFSAMPYFVYMLASRRHGTLYVGVTNDLARRVYEHRTKAQSGFTSQYGVERLVWYETYERVDEAIGREKMLKKWRRDWKVVLIEEHNPEWIDLYLTLNS